MEVEVLQHFLILCCYGGIPYLDYRNLGDGIKHESTMSLDPTDWIAVDTSGEEVELMGAYKGRPFFFV